MDRLMPVDRAQGRFYDGHGIVGHQSQTKAKQGRLGIAQRLDFTECGTPFSETRDTVFFDLKTPEEKVMMALKMLLVKVDLAGSSFVLGVTEDTVLAWLQRAAHKAAEINAHLLRDLPVTQVQLDELWSFLKRKHTSQ